MEKKGYVILEIGWEYNDEYYSTGNYGETYEAPKEVFFDKEKAKKELLKREIAAFKGVELNSYISDGIEDIYIGNTTIEELFTYVNENFGVKISEDDYYDFLIPKKATDEQISGLLKLINLRFNKLHEIKING